MKSRIALIALLLIIVSIIVTLNLFFYQSYQAEMATQINKQQLIIARTVASSIQDLVAHYREESADLAKLLGIRGLGGEGFEEFFSHAFTELRDDLKTKAALLDGNGKLVYSSWDKDSIRDYAWNSFGLIMQLQDGETLVDYNKIESGYLFIAAPVYAGSKFKGSLLVGINIDEINARFLQPVKSGQRGYAWMMDSTGTLIYHPLESDMVGKNIFANDEYCFECHDSFNTEKQILESTDIGSSSYAAPSGEDKLIAFSRIDPLGWIVCVSIPYSEVTASINNSMRLHSLLVMSILVATVIGSGVVILINRGRIKAEAKAGYADKMREYAEELEVIVHESTKELRSEKGKLDAVVSSIEAGIAIFDKDAGCACSWMNKVMKRWLSEEKAGSFTLSSIFTDEGVVSELCGSLLERKVVQDVKHLDLGNKKGYFQISVSPFKDPDGSGHFLVLLQDVTELKNAEEQLKHSEKLTALARLSAGVAHEIGNPLTSISSYVQILKGMESDEFKSEALDTISRHIKRIVSIVKEMAEFSKTRTEQVGPYDVLDLVESTVELVKYDRRSKNIRMDISVPEDLPRVNVDGNQLIQVFMNIIFNASDAMLDGGILKISGESRDGFVEIAFEDTGQGIDKEHMARIFDPFFTTKDTGTGLGLSVSYGIIKSFGGDIIVESEPGSGSVFRVRVPAHDG